METIEILIIAGIIFIIQMLFFPKKSNESNIVITKELSSIKEEIGKIQTNLGKVDTYIKNSNIKKDTPIPHNKSRTTENVQNHEEFYNSLSELVSKTELRLRNMIEGIKYISRANTLNIYTLEDFENEQSSQQENIVSQ
jgi:hypothetical protein